MKKNVILFISVVMAVSLAGCAVINEKADEVKEQVKEAAESAAKSVVESAVESAIVKSVDETMPIPDDVDKRWISVWEQENGDCMIIKYTDCPDAYVYDVLMYDASDNTSFKTCVFPEDVSEESLTLIMPVIGASQATVTLDGDTLVLDYDGTQEFYERTDKNVVSEWISCQFKTATIFESFELSN